MPKKAKEPVERLVVKLPKSLAAYFRQEFAHGKRSDFVAEAIMRYRHDQDIRDLERELRKVGQRRQRI